MRFLLRNWHIKLGAAALAVILYTGFVYSGSFSEDTLNGVPIRIVGQPAGSYLVTQQLPLVDVHYRVASNAQRITPDSVGVTLDLSGYDMNRPMQLQALSVKVDSLQDGLTVLSWSPPTVSVAIDRLGTRDGIPVVVERGTIPDGLEIGAPRYDPATVSASGPESQLAKVDHVVARVVIQASGIDIDNQQVDLVPVDIDGIRVDSVELTPSSATVSIDVQTLETTKTVPIRPVVTGTPADGYEVGTVAVIPSVVTLRGTPDVLAEITEVTTQAVSVAGATQTQNAAPEIVVPQDTTLAAGQDSTPSVSVQVRPTLGTRTFLVGVLCQGAPPGSACLPQLTQLSLTLQGPTAILSGLSAADLTPILDVTGLGPGSHDVSVSLNVPQGTDLLSLSPAFVTVVIEPPPTPSPVP